MLVPSTAAIALLLSGRDRSAGAVLALAVAVKFTAIVLLPFILIAALTRPRQIQILKGCVYAAIPVAVMSVVLFGLNIPNLAAQSGVVTAWSIPNLVGLALGFGGVTSGLLRIGDVLVVTTVLVLMRRRRDWVSGAGWSTIALISSVAWLMPWYIVWALPLAALGTSARLRRVALAFSVFLVLTFTPETGVIVGKLGINPMGTALGRAAMVKQERLQR
jgi:hypothetical protein